MPIKQLDPYKDPTLRMRPEFNAYLEVMKQAAALKTLPLAYGPYLEAIQSWPGYFEQVMGRPTQDIVIEIGCHKGDTLCKMAQDHPNVCFIGLDITIKRVVETAKKAHSLELKNLLSLLVDGKFLPRLFRPGSLSGAVVFFPDPWGKKKRQSKNRLVSQTFLQNLITTLRPEAVFWFKTDHQGYFEEVVASIEDLSAYFEPRSFNQPVSGETAKLFNMSYSSRFERGFQERSIPYFEKQWVRTTLPFETRESPNECLV